MARVYKVGTFWRPEEGHTLVKSRINAYTMWYGREWPGCVEYYVEAESGAEAKRIAKQKRLEFEREKMKNA